MSRSSARPWAALASRSAVAGATTTRSAVWPIRTCGTSWTSVQTSVATGLPDSAAQVAAPTNSQRRGGRDDGDVVAGLGEPAQQLAGLVRRDAAADAEDDARPGLGGRPSAAVLVSSTVGSAVGRRRLGGLGGRRPRRRARLGVDVLAGQQVVVDLAQRDRQRLLLHVGVHERADVLQQALAELGVVGVDLPGALGAVEDQLVLASRSWSAGRRSGGW